MIDTEKLIAALRCSSSPKLLGKCEECEYQILEELVNGIPVNPDVIIDGKEYWQSCDTDRMAMDAAIKLEGVRLREQPIHVEGQRYGSARCPICKEPVDFTRWIHGGTSYCTECGQLMSWDDEEEQG